MLIVFIKIALRAVFFCRLRCNGYSYGLPTLFKVPVVMTYQLQIYAKGSHKRGMYSKELSHRTSQDIS
jgi:hypothetical protein